MISVVMPVYNCPDYLHEAVQSVLRQTYNDFEFIIVNDGSTDKTVEIIDYYSAQDVRVKTLKSEHTGISRALNMGIDYASGEIIARMDGDDICEPTRFERQIAYLKSHPEIDLLATCISEVIGNAPEHYIHKMYNVYNIMLDDKNTEFYLLNEHVLFHPSWMFKKNMYHAIGGYDSRYDGAEDYDFLLRAFGKGFVIRNLQEPLMKLRLTKDSSSRKDYAGKHESIKCCFRIKLDYLERTIDFNSKRIAIWGAGKGGSMCYEVLRERYPDVKVICFYDRDKEGFFEGLPMYMTRDIDLDCFDLLIGATEPGKQDVLRFMKDNSKELYKDYVIFAV